MPEPEESLPEDEFDFVPVPVPATSEIVGVVAGVVPFFISFSSSSSQTVNGQVVESSYFDPLAVGGGAVAALAGLFCFVLLGKTAPADKTKRIAAAGALVALGAYQLARGFGVVG